MNRQQRFYSTMQKGLKEIEVSENNDALKSMYPQKLQSKYGNLLIHVEQAKNSQTAKLYTCYCRFEDVDRAKQEMDALHFNRYSGKWNFHIPVKNHEPERVAEIVLNTIRTVI